MFFSKPSKSFNVKPSLNELLDRRKDLLLLAYTYIPSTSTVGLLLHLQHYQRCELMILKMWVKSKFVLCQPRYYNLLTEKYKEIHVLEVLSFERRTLAVNLKKFSRNTIFRWYIFGKFYFVKFNYFSRRPNKVK